MSKTVAQENFVSSLILRPTCSNFYSLSLSAATRKETWVEEKLYKSEIHINISVGFFRAGGKVEPWDAPKGVQRYTLDDLVRATNNFSKEHEIGSGGFGKVFYGNFPGNKKLAIKRASTSTSANGQTQFRNEVYNYPLDRRLPSSN